MHDASLIAYNREAWAAHSIGRRASPAVIPPRTDGAEVWRPVEVAGSKPTPHAEPAPTSDAFAIAAEAASMRAGLLSLAARESQGISSETGA